MQNLFLGQIALKRPWVRGAHSRGPRLSGSSPKLGAIRCCRDAGTHKCFDDCKKLPGEGREAERLYGIVINQPSCVNGVPSGCPAPTPSSTPVVNTTPPPSGSGSKLNCCVVKGPGGNQIQRCYGENCQLSWVSGEGIYPGVPECGADGRPASCHTPTAATGQQQPLQTQPLQQAPGPTQVPLSTQGQGGQPPQTTNTSAGQMQTTQAQNPTGTAAGDPFRAVAPRTPVQAMPLPASPGTSQVQMAPPVQPPAPPQEYGECPEDAQPLERWAKACAMAHRR
jgi:hypothetical protein